MTAEKIIEFVQATVVGPEDMLVIAFEQGLSAEQVDQITREIRETPLRGRVILLDGGATLARVKPV